MIRAQGLGQMPIATALCLALLIAATPVAAQTLDPSPVPSPEVSPASPGPDAIDELFAELTMPDGLESAALEVAAADRELLAAIDPELPAIMAELDAMAAEELAAYLASAVPAPDASPVPGESPGVDASTQPDASIEPASEGRSGMAFLSAVPRRLPEPERFGQGGSYLTAIGQVVGAVERFVGETKPDNGSSRDPGSASTQSRTETVGGFPVSVSTRYQVTNARVRDEITFGVELTERYAIPSRTPGAPPIEVTDTGSATVHIDVCPDEDGTIIARADTHATVTASGNGLAYQVIADADDTATATISDQATVSAISHVADATRRATGDLGVFSNGGDGETDSHLEGSVAWTTDGAGSATSSTSGDISTAQGANEADLRAWALTGAFAAAVDTAAIRSASRVWRNGRCLELKVEPPGKTVDPGSRTSIKVTIHHKAYDDEVKRPVKATFTGTEKVEPLDSPVMAPADFTYTATSQQQGEGVITFRSVSNRGIAERTETYRVEQRLLLDVDGTVTFRLSGVSGRGTLKGRGLKVKVAQGADPEVPPGVSIEGDLTINIRVSSGGDCSGSGKETYGVHPGLDASAKLVGAGQDARLSVLLRPKDPNAQLKTRVRCAGATAELSFPVSTMWPSFRPGGEFEMPLAGGTARRSANVQGVRSKFTYKLYQERPR